MTRRRLKHLLIALVVFVVITALAIIFELGPVVYSVHARSSTAGSGGHAVGDWAASNDENEQ